MRVKQIVTTTVPTLLLATAVHAAGGGASPMAGVFTTVEGWLTGDIAEWLGICAIVGLGALIWFAHDYGHIFGYTFKGILGVAVVVFAITEYTTAFGGGASISASTLLIDLRWVAQIASYTALTFITLRYGLLAAHLFRLRSRADEA